MERVELISGKQSGTFHISTSDRIEGKHVCTLVECGLQCLKIYNNSYDIDFVQKRTHSIFYPRPHLNTDSSPTWKCLYFSLFFPVWSLSLKTTRLISGKRNSFISRCPQNAHISEFRYEGKLLKGTTTRMVKPWVFMIFWNIENETLT